MGEAARTILWVVPWLALTAASPALGQAGIFDEVGSRLESGDYPGIIGGMASLDGRVVMEAYARGNGPEERHDIRSATKSITALLIGELVADGRLKRLRTPIAELIPGSFDALPANDPHRDITVEDALTMRTGLACDDWSPASVGHEDKMYQTRDWAAFLLAQPFAHERGEQFSYCTGGVVLLGRVIETLSGQAVPAFAAERLFQPLGIEGERWESTPTGHTDTGGHLRLRLRDLHAIGRLVADRGTWNGDAVADPDWIDTMTRAHTDVPHRRERYGYLWWLDRGEVKGKPVSLVYAHGNGGNFIFIVPELRLVAAFNGRNYGKPEQFTPLRILTQEIVPALVE